jgi:catechol 2,3-dioxygenase-like lactoylglutathione lyase family enzyme
MKDVEAGDDRKAELDPGRGRVVPKQLAHVVRRSNRLEEMIHWYCEVLGAEVVHRDGMLAFLTYDDEHHRIAIASLPGLEEPQAFAAGTDHIAFTYASLGDLLYTWERLKRAGIEPFWCIHHGPTISMYFKDPDGNRVELQVDTLPSIEAIDAWMKSERFAANPIGVVFDPEDLARRYRSGEPFDTLLVQPPMPPDASPLDMLRF